MKSNNIKGKRKSLRRQWSVDVPSSIQKKFREVTGCRRSKSLEEDVYKQKLLHETEYYDEQGNRRDKGSFENFGQDHSEFGPPHSPCCSSSSSPWYSFEDDNSDASARENETQNESELDDIQIEIKSCESFEKFSALPVRTKDILSVNTCGLLSTIDELVLRSPTKRASPAAELDMNRNKTEMNDVPRKFAKSADTCSGDEEPEIGERFRRYAICEEMERYIIVDHKGLSLRKYRETLIRHRVLKELCLL
jgi:hypothetical protein